MRLSLALSIAAIAAVLVGCNLPPQGRSPMSAKAWDTSFVAIKPIPHASDTAMAQGQGMQTITHAGYGTMPAPGEWPMPSDAQDSPSAPALTARGTMLYEGATAEALIPAPAASAATTVVAPTIVVTPANAERDAAAPAAVAPNAHPAEPAFTAPATHAAPAGSESWYRQRIVELAPREAWSAADTAAPWARAE